MSRIARIEAWPANALLEATYVMRSTLVLSILIGLASSLAGLTVSYYADLPPGGTIVLVAAGVYVLALAGSALRGR